MNVCLCCAQKRLTHLAFSISIPIPILTRLVLFSTTECCAVHIFFYQFTSHLVQCIFAHIYIAQSLILLRLFAQFSVSTDSEDMMHRTTKNTICIYSMCIATLFLSIFQLFTPITTETLVHCSFPQLKIKIKLMTLNKTNVDNGRTIHTNTHTHTQTI